MRLIVMFKDKPAMMAHRAKYEEQHLAYLEANHKEISIGGGLRKEVGGFFVGGLWVLEVDSFERANELVVNDPYYDSTLREFDILVWGKAGNREVVL